MADEKTHLAAVKALFPASAKAYTLQEIKDLGADPPESYNEVTVSQRIGPGPRRNGAPSQITGWRVLVRSVAQIYDNAQEMRRQASVLHEAKVTVAGEDFYIERSATDDPIAEDDGWWSGASEFTY